MVSETIHQLYCMMNHVLIRRFISTGCAIETSLELYTKLTDLLRKGNCHHQALSLFQQLHRSSSFTTNPISPILPSLIKASSFSHFHSHAGLQLHCLAIKTACFSNLFVSNSLVPMYGKFFNVTSARQVFEEMPLRDSISWNSLINCYIQNGHSVQAINMFKRMYVDGYLPKPELMARILSVCSSEGLTRLGKEIHSFVVVSGMIKDSVFLATSVVDFYMRCGHMQLAFWVFDQMDVRNKVSWTALIRGCTVNQDHRLAMDCFQRMQVEGVKPNRVTLISVMPACAEICLMQNGKGLHGYAFRHGFESEPRFSAALMHMYCQYRGARALQMAQTIMERSTKRDVVMWTSIMESYVRDGDIIEATKHFSRMLQEGILPNSVTLLTIFSACTSQVFLSFGRAIHSYALKSGLLCDTHVGNSLISMYSKSGCLAESKLIFTEMPMKDFVSWSALIDALGISCYGKEALQIFRDMKERGVYADSITLLSALKACNYGGLVEEGQELFHNMIKEKKIPLGIEHYACQIDLLARAGKIEVACEVIRQMPFTPSVKIWSSLVSACMDHGRLKAAEMLACELINLEPENGANYKLLAMVYAKSDEWNSVEALWRFMRAKGLKKSSGFSKAQV